MSIIVDPEACRFYFRHLPAAVQWVKLYFPPTYVTTPCLHLFNLFYTGQVLANMAAMGSEKFCADRLPGGKVVGNFDFAKVNTRGGSLSLGHPFGATGEYYSHIE